MVSLFLLPIFIFIYMDRIETNEILSVELTSREIEQFVAFRDKLIIGASFADLENTLRRLHLHPRVAEALKEQFSDSVSRRIIHTATLENELFFALERLSFQIARGSSADFSVNRDIVAHSADIATAVMDPASAINAPIVQHLASKIASYCRELFPARLA